MVIKRTSRNNLAITISSTVGSDGLQRLIEYAKYLEATTTTKAKQSDVDQFAEEVNRKWWKKNKKRPISVKLQ